MKRFIAILLCVLMIVPQAVVGSLASYDAPVAVSDKGNPIKMEVVGTLPLYEHVHGDWRTEELDNGDVVEWFDYECAKAKADVVFYYSDGTTETLNVDDIGGFSFGSSQCWENPWTVGNTYEAHLFYNGENDSLIDNPLSCTYNIEVVENPVESIDVYGDFTFRENVDGMWATYVEGDGEYEYYFYQPTNAIEEVCFNYKDGESEYVSPWELGQYTRDKWSLVYNQTAFDPWVGGNSYEVVFCYGDVACSFWIEIEESNVERIEIAEGNAVTEGTCGYYADYTVSYPDVEGYESGVYFNYEAYQIINAITVYYKDGTSEVISPNTDGISYHYYQDPFENRWTVGNTYEITVEYCGATAVHQVEILPSPVESIEILEINDLVEGQDSWLREEWDSEDNRYEYNYYDPDKFIDTVQVNYKDGTSEVKSVYDLEGRGIEFQQNYMNQWTAGNTYPATLWYQGVSCDFEVNVVADPIESIEIYEYRNLVAGFDGSYYSFEDDETGEPHTYFHYYPSWAVDSVKVNYTDGSYEYRTLDSFEEFGWEYNQSFENQWLPGNSYPVTLTIGSHRVDFELYVEPSNIESIEIIEQRDLTEGYDDWEAEEWIEADSQWVTYNKFSPYNAIVRVRINYKDGTSWEGYRYDLGDYTVNATQNYYNQWTAGNTYTATLYYGGVSCDFDITIKEDPVDYIEVYETRSLLEGFDGYYEYVAMGTGAFLRPHYRYNAADAIVSVKITYKDGTSDIVALDELEDYSVYQGSEFELMFSNWTAGNYYDATLYVGKNSCDFQVYIAPNDIASVEVYELGYLVENVDCHTEIGYDFDLESNSSIEYEYNFYEVEYAIKSVKITYTDGSSEIVPFDRYGDMDYAFNTEQNFGEYEWSAGNSYPVIMYYAGKSCEIEVPVVSDPIASFEIYETETVVEGIDGWYENWWNYERGYYSFFYYPMYEAVKSVKINYNDGTYDILSYDEWRDRGDSYLEWNQDYENQWLPGNTYTVRMGVGDHIIDVPVYITPNDIESIVPYDVQPIKEGTNSTSEDLVDDEWVTYPFYNADSAFDYVLVTYKDGTTELVDRRWDCEYTIITDQRYFNQWTAGNTYTATFMCKGKTAEFTVTIVEDPVESIEIVETQPIYENLNGWWDWGYSESGDRVEFFRYYPWEAIIKVKINYKDGTSEIFDYYEWSQQDNTWVINNQSADNQWTAGNTYTATLWYGSHSCDFEVKIESRPIVDIEFPNAVDTIREGSLGGWASQMVDGEWKDYFEYDLVYPIGWLTVHYSDGSTERYFPGDSVVSIESNQNYFNQWTGGNTYPVTITVDGYSEELSFYIEPTNVESFEVLETIPFYEGDGYEDGYYDDELGEYVSYIYYDIWDAIDQVKVNYKDGTSEIVSYHELGSIIGGTSYLFHNQGPDEIWTAGNTYTAILDMGMFSDEFEVSIIENPIASIEVVETRPLEENQNGWFNEHWDENGYVGDWFCYSVSEAVVSVKVNYKDGTSEILSKDQLGSWGSSTDQWYENQWTVGNTYTATFKYMGHSCEFNVSIVEYTPYEYFVQEGGAYITGMKDYWYLYNNDIEELVIPSEINGYSVVGIAYFRARANTVKTLTIPESVKFITDGAFYEFLNVETVYIEGTGTVLSPSVFGGMYEISEFVLNEEHPDYVVIDGVIFDKDVTTIVAYPYAKGDTYELPVTISDLKFMQYYYDVNFIIHPDSAEFVVENGITYDKAKTQIISCDKTVSGEYVMPETVEYIPQMMFQGCENLTGVVMSPLVTEIAYATFDNCPNLKSVVLPTELQTVGYYAFSDCTALEEIELPSKLINIESKAFYNTGLKALTVPGNVEYLGSYSFMNSQLETLTVEQALAEYGTYIGYCAFGDNVSLETVVLKEGVSGLGSYVFANCASLKEINIPDSTTMFGEYIFQNCDSLTYLPIGANQDHIPTGEFYDCDGLVDVVIPDQVVALLTNAFRSCKNLKTVQMHEGITYFERYIFAGCTSLTELPLSESQTYIAYGEFSDCTGLVNVELPERITEICAYAFNNCTSLESINLSDNINYIDRGAFQGCTALKAAYIGRDVEAIHMYTFKNSGITEVVIGENVQYIEYEAFMNSKLTSVDIPASVTDIAYFAFFGCEDLAEINMPDTLVTLGGHSFGGTKWYNDQPEGLVYLGSSLYNYKGDITEETELYVKPGTLAIAGHAFENGCTDSWYWGYRNDERYQNELYDRSGLKAVHMYEGLSVIGNHAFYNCDGLTAIYVPSTLTTVLGSAFADVDNLEIIYYAGTEEQWNNIVVEAENEAFENCEVVFNYVDESYPEEPDDVVIGDIDGNDKINSVDLFKLKLFVKQITTPTDAEYAAADVNGDGKVNTVDVFYVKYRILKGEWGF